VSRAGALAFDLRTLPDDFYEDPFPAYHDRDPAHFRDPDRLDLGRTPNRHLAFITGIHACAGMWLARMEGRVAIERLVARFERLHAPAPPVRARRARFRVVSSFPIQIG
jgi:cytochrome P450